MFPKETPLGLYEHQAAAIRRARDHNIVLQAPTASGKSPAFQVPMLDTLVRPYRVTEVSVAAGGGTIGLKKIDPFLELALTWVRPFKIR